MSNSEVLYAARRGVSRRGVSRRVGRALNRLDDATGLAVAEVRAEADVQAAHVDAVTAVGQRALVAVAFTTQLEQQLAQLVPLATTRLQGVADLTSLAIGQVVMDTATMRYDR